MYLIKRRPQLRGEGVTGLSLFFNLREFKLLLGYYDSRLILVKKVGLRDFIAFGRKNETCKNEW